MRENFSSFSSGYNERERERGKVRAKDKKISKSDVHHVELLFQVLESKKKNIFTIFVRLESHAEKI
jgi:hypothetical protein